MTCILPLQAGLNKHNLVNAQKEKEVRWIRTPDKIVSMLQQKMSFRSVFVTHRPAVGLGGSTARALRSLYRFSLTQRLLNLIMDSQVVLKMC